MKERNRVISLLVDTSDIALLFGSLLFFSFGDIFDSLVINTNRGCVKCMLTFDVHEKVR